ASLPSCSHTSKVAAGVHGTAATSMRFGQFHRRPLHTGCQTEFVRFTLVGSLLTHIMERRLVGSQPAMISDFSELIWRSYQNTSVDPRSGSPWPKAANSLRTMLTSRWSSFGKTKGRNCESLWMTKEGKRHVFVVKRTFTGRD